MVAAYFADYLRCAALADAGIGENHAAGKFAVDFVCQCGALLWRNDVFQHDPPRPARRVGDWVDQSQRGEGLLAGVHGMALVANRWLV